MQNYRDISCIVFDLDGTLVDSMTAFADFAADVLRSHYGMELAEGRKAYQRTSGQPFPEQLRQIIGEDARHAAAVADFNRQKSAAYDSMNFFTDVKSVLQNLREAGYKMCVSSNNDAVNVCQKLEKSGLMLDLVLGFAAPEFAKGEAHFREIERQLETPRSQLLFIGDSLHDARLAQQCGVRFVARAGTFEVADFATERAVVVSDFYELAKLLGARL